MSKSFTSTVAFCVCVIGAFANVIAFANTQEAINIVAGFFCLACAGFAIAIDAVNR